MSAYIVFNYQVNDFDDYRLYLSDLPHTLEEHGAEILAADFESESLEGEARAVTIVLRFDSAEAAKAWHRSPEYQAIIGLRLHGCEGIAVLADGIEA